MAGWGILPDLKAFENEGQGVVYKSAPSSPGARRRAPPTPKPRRRERYRGGALLGQQGQEGGSRLLWRSAALPAPRWGSEAYHWGSVLGEGEFSKARDETYIICTPQFRVIGCTCALSLCLCVTFCPFLGTPAQVYRVRCKVTKTQYALKKSKTRHSASDIQKVRCI